MLQKSPADLGNEDEFKTNFIWMHIYEDISLMTHGDVGHMWPFATQDVQLSVSRDFNEAQRLHE